ncbi:MAG: MFS transporter, partial [Anaerotignaceae bacterium]
MKNKRLILLATTALFWASEYCHVPYFTPYLYSLNITATIIGVLVGCYGLSQTIIRVPLGIFTDATSAYKKVIIFGCLCTTLSSLGLYLFTNIIMIFICRALAGVAAATWIAFTVMYSGYFNKEEGFKAMAQINGANNVGKMGAFFLGTITATLFTYREPLLMSVLTGVIAIVLSLFIEDVPLKKEPLSSKKLFATFRDRSVIIPGVFALVMMMTVHATAFSFTSSVAESIGASKVEIGFSTSLFSFIQVMAVGFLGSKFISNIKDNALVAMGFILMALYCFIISVAQSVYLIFLAQLIGGFANLLLMSMLSSASIRYCDPTQKATSMGLFQAIYGVGMTMGPMFMGRIVDIYSFKVSFIVFGG